MAQLAVFILLETFSYTSIFKMIVLTFYFNKSGLWLIRNYCTESKIVVSLQCLSEIAR
jgi:hypothetical protein